MVEALCLTVADRPVGKERGKAAPAGIEKCALPGDIEKGLLLPGEARFGKILRCRAAADRDADRILFAARRQSVIGFTDGRLDLRWKRPFQKRMPDRSTCHLKRGAPGIERFDPAPHFGFNAVGRDIVPIGLRRCGEASRHSDTALRQRADHLTERSILSANHGDVAASNILKPGNKGVGHRNLRVIRERCSAVVERGRCLERRLNLTRRRRSIVHMVRRFSARPITALLPPAREKASAVRWA